MAKKSYSVQLDDVPNPQDYSRAGALVEKAGQLQGQAKAMRGSADAELLQTVGVAATQAYFES